MDQKRIIEEWIKDSAEKNTELEQTEEYVQLEQISAHLQQFKAPVFNTESELTKFHSTKPKGKGVVRSLSVTQWTLRIAASLIVLAIIYFGYNKVSEVATKTTIASTQKFKTFFLPDSSEVVLSRMSEISFNTNKWNDSREVELNGEAYFKVKKGSTFTVKTNLGDVKVIGTQFDVFNREGSFLVNCYEGVVGVSLGGKYIELPKGRGISRYAKHELTNISFEDSSPSWIENKRTFRSTPLKAVFHEIERTYNVTISTNTLDTEQLFSGRIPTTQLNESLKIVTASVQARFEIEGKHVSILPL